MDALDTKKSYKMLTMNTLAFTVSFMIWLMYAALIDSLTKPVVIDGQAVKGILPGLKDYAFFLKSIPILTGSLIRLPIGTLTDKFGGRPVFITVLLISAAGSLMVGFVDSVAGFVIGGLIFGMAGTTFAVGIAFSSIWFSKGKQGLALGIFGAGNAGAAITNLLTPILLTHYLQRKIVVLDGVKQTIIGNPEGWRTVPMIYAGVMLIMAIAFWFLTENRTIASEKTLAQRLSPLKQGQVWRFGVYYLFLFGGFVALSLTLKNYYENVYDVSPTNAGALVCLFALLSAGFRAVGGWMSDKYGARAVMHGVLISCIFSCAALSTNVPFMVFVIISCFVGTVMGIGMAAVYKHIPVYFPKEVPVVGAMVGVIGGLGGFILPNVFKQLLKSTVSEQYPNGNFATSWMVLTGISAFCLIWMIFAIKKHKVKREDDKTAAEPV